MAIVSKSLLHKIYRRVFWSSPILHLTYLKARGFDIDLDNTSLVVQGFPRSGNTYLSVSLNEYKKFKGNVFSHIHTPAIFFHALRKNIPVVMPIRDPVSSIVSLSQLTGWDDLRCIDHYKCYYRLSRPYADRLNILNFDTFTKDTPKSFNCISTQTGLEFREEFHEKIQEFCFKEIDRLALTRTDQGMNNWIHRPNDVRNSSKAEIKARLEQFHGDALAECEDLFQFFLKKSL
ncbi:MAG: hypothetical protein P1U37_18570 [Minwuia sp.]|nr:hypothetical protein [Minwuia sp.]